MLYPAPTSKIDPSLARGILEQIVEPTATRPGYIIVSFPNTSYQMHLIPAGPITAETGKRIIGTIAAQSRRIDVVQTGGRYVEPVYGRPRRVQGSIIAVNQVGAGAGTIVVDATVPIHITPTDPRQQAAGFEVGQFVSFDVLDGAAFTQA
jgi:hypothetical protein